MGTVCILLKGKDSKTVMMRERTSQILRSYFKAQAKNEESQKQIIIETAAQLIKSDIKSNVPSLTNQYPSAKMLDLDSALSFVHCQRVHYQIMVWTDMENDMNPVDWGWKLEDNHFVPVMTNKTAAPESLLHMVHCNCTTAC